MLHILPMALLLAAIHALIYAISVSNPATHTGQKNGPACAGPFMLNGNYV